ncbi:MAG: DUF222 domain-containing protein [Acidimicrobiales bacterium]
MELLTRLQLVDRVGALRRVRKALDARPGWCARSTVWATRVWTRPGCCGSRGGVSARTAGRMASTAKKLESLPRTAEALAEGAITFEHAEQVAKAAETVTA